VNKQLVSEDERSQRLRESIRRNLQELSSSEERLNDNWEDQPSRTSERNADRKARNRRVEKDDIPRKPAKPIPPPRMGLFGPIFDKRRQPCSSSQALRMKR
jgi:hypothetical protein